VKPPAVHADVRLQRVDLFGSDYTGRYGHIFNGKSFREDFGCLNPSAARKGYGRITSIKGGEIEVEKSEGRKSKLRVGSCTRLEATGNAPKVGQAIFYSQVQGNIYQATCGDW
jgi:hypothetical protein